jgi:lipoprotein-anchoring transpeptidase ErfK/SrfK
MTGLSIRVDAVSQGLHLIAPDGATIRRYTVSTARNGLGERSGSHCTPRGRHLIRARIGTGQPVNTVFRGRRPTGELWSPQLAAQHPGRDWILTRILWLSGCEPGFNRLGAVDTMRRYIYIHGTPDTVPVGSPGSIGCIRMRNIDIVELFDLVSAGTPVEICPS